MVMVMIYLMRKPFLFILQFQKTIWQSKIVFVWKQWLTSWKLSNIYEWEIFDNDDDNDNDDHKWSIYNDDDGDGDDASDGKDDGHGDDKDDSVFEL